MVKSWGLSPITVLSHTTINRQLRDITEPMYYITLHSKGFLITADKLANRGPQKEPSEVDTDRSY